MFKQSILRQPDGKLALWDTDNCIFLLVSASEEEIIDTMIAETVKDAKDRATDWLNWFKRNEDKRKENKSVPNYYMTFKDALEQLEAVHGKEERDKVWKYLGKIPKVNVDG